MQYPIPYRPAAQQQGGPGRANAGEELLRAFPASRAINPERSVFDLPLEVQGKNTALRISLPPSFPQERPMLTMLLPVQSSAVDHSGRVRCQLLDEWNSAVPGRCNIVALVHEALALILGNQACAGGGPPQGVGSASINRRNDGGNCGVTGIGAGGGGAGGGGEVDRTRELDTLPTQELERLVTDDDAFQGFLVKWMQDAPAARALAEIQRQNASLALDALSMQCSIEEARNHVAIVRSSEYAATKAGFEELLRRQEAVLAKLSPAVLLDELRKTADEVDEKSSSLTDSYYAGQLPLEQYVEQYTQRRTEYHMLDLKRQAAEQMLY